MPTPPPTPPYDTDQNGTTGPDGFAGTPGRDRYVGLDGNDNLRGADGDDVLIGDGGNDFIQGQNGNDYIEGGDGFDQLRGGNGDDTILGGAGDDLIRGGNGIDILDGGDGNDRISFFELDQTQGVVADLAAQTMSNDGYGNSETLISIEGLGADTRFVDTFLGSDGVNLLFGRSDDIIDGRGGDDSLISGASVNGGGTINGGDGVDTLQLTGDFLVDSNGDGIAETVTTTIGVSVNLSAPTNQLQNDANGRQATLLNIENLVGTNLNDRLIGNAGANVLTGGGGNDVLVGLGGNNTLLGGAGSDTLVDLLGGTNDVLDGGEEFDNTTFGVDIVSYYDPNLGSSGVTVSLALQGTAQVTGRGSDTLTGIEVLAGTRFADTLTGDEFGNGLFGLGGADTLSSGAGDDSIVATGFGSVIDGGADNDILSFWTNLFTGMPNDIASGVTYDLSIGGTQASAGGNLMISNVENLSGSRSNDTLTGDSGDNSIGGSYGSDTLNGGDGDDSLYGDGTFFFDNLGNASFVEEIPVPDGQPELGVAAGNDLLNGGAGDDYLDGGEGDDVLSGGTGNDTVFGGSGLDTYSYNYLTDGSDTVDLSGGNDIINVTGGGVLRVSFSFSAAANGSSIDQSTAPPIPGGLAIGAQGQDSFGTIFGSVSRFSDENVQFIAGGDTKFDIRNVDNNSPLSGLWDTLTFGSFNSNIDLSSSYTDNVVFLGIGNGIFVGGAGADYVRTGFNASFDSISGGAGNDIIVTGTGVDTLDGGDGNDVIFGGPSGQKNVTGGAGQDRYFFNMQLGGTHLIDLGDSSGSSGIDIVNIQGPSTTPQIRLTLDGSSVGNGNKLRGDGQLAVELTPEDINDNPLGSTSYGDDEHILYNSPNGSAGFDVRDSITGQQYGVYSFAFLGGATADIDTALSPTRSYFYSLGGGDDVVTGGNLADYMDGGIGNDTLSGADGDDVIAGRDGNDTLNGGNGTDIAVFAKARASYSVAIDGSGYAVTDAATGERDTVASVETLRFADGDFAPLALANNVFAKNSTSYAVIFQNGGYTVIDRETLAEINVGNVPTIRFANGDFASANIDLNVIILPPGTTNDGRGGTPNGDYIVGNDGYNFINGNDGDDFVLAGGNGGAEPSVDQIRGNNGNDTLVGGAGADLFRGGAGIDRFFGQGGNDRISFFEVTATQGVIADLETGIISNDGFGNVETFSSIEGLGGSTRFADTFRGSAGNNLFLGDTSDTIEGRGGDDRFQLSGSVGGGGTIDGGDGFDFMYALTADRQEDTNGDGIADSVAATQGVSIDLALGQVLNDGFGNTATLISIEGIGGGSLSDSLLGDANDNRINLSNGNDVIDGRGGIDTLDVAQAISTDFVITRTGSTTYTITDTTGVNSVLSDVEFVEFSDGTFALSALAVGPGPGDDYVEGTEGPDTLDGLGGNDTIRGLGGDDNLFGSAGNDDIDGGAGTDVVEGGDGDDTLSGGQGNDIVRGGNGNDAITDSVGGGSNQLFGDAGDDVFTLNGGFNFINGGTGNDVVVNTGAVGTDVITHDMATGGSDSYNTGGGIDFVTLTTVAGSETRITFTSSEVGNGSATDSNTMANQDGGLAVRIQLEGNSGGLTGPISRGDDEGVYYTASEGSTVEVRDLVSGASRGSFRTAFLGTNGNDVLAAPTGAFAGASLYANAGMGDDTVNGSTVDDFLVGGAGNDALSGNSGDDQFLGGGGNDSVNGGDGDDVVTGGLGDDAILGGAGDDTAIVNVAADGTDSINLGDGGDVVLVSGAGQVRLTFTSGEVGNANVNDGGILANQDGGLAVRMQAEDGADGLTGAISRTDDEGITFVAAAGTTFDVRDLPTGTARGNGFQVVTLGTSALESLTAVNPALSYYINGGAGRDTITGGNVADFLVGGVDNDILDGGQGDDGLLGGAGVDRLVGGTGNDRLDGGAETDFLEGGIGNDTYVTDGIDAITELLGEGIDEVISSADASLGANVEDLTLVGAAINGTGNELGNIVTGNVNNNLLRGNDGNDLLIGALGNDTLQGGNGNDVIDGGDGDDSLDGGVAGDIMTGGAGNDLYQVDNGSDRVVETVGGGTNDRIVSSVSYTLVGEVEVLNLVGAAAFNGTGSETNNSINGNDLNNVLNGGDGNDILSGNNGNDMLLGGNGTDTLRGGEGVDVLDGGTGADSMSGGNGDDAYYIDNSSDVVGEVAGGGNDTVLVSANYVMAREIEFGTLLGTADLTLTGNILANTLIGNSGNNVIRGGDGNDSVLGNDGNDTLFGDAGADILRGGNGDDILVGGAGADQLQGGVGADTFRFLSTADLGLTGATSDRVLDFSSVQGDRIDLTAIDANSALAGNQAFSFIGGAAFTGVAGQLRVQASGTNQLVYGDVNGDGVADFLIVVTPVGAVPLVGGDFQL